VTSEPADVEAEQANENTRCLRCFRPLELCFCSTIPVIHNRTDVVIVQHRRERSHAFNTARIVRHALQKCTLLCNHMEELVEQFSALQLSAGAGLLYPSPQARLLTGVGPSEHPDQLIILDGTWSHAQALVRHLPQLQALPHFVLAPTAPSRYRIRREPNEQAVSTVEAAVDALRIIEPETIGFDQLLLAFDQMIDDQIGRSKSNWRRNSKRRRGVTNVPRAFHGDLSNIVVAYGELDRGGESVERDKHRQPIYWMAQRLGSNEVFRCAIQSESNHDDEFLQCLRLSHADFAAAVSPMEFQDRWKAFLKSNDEVAVYHPSTANLLNKMKLTPPMVLKSIKLEQIPCRGTLDEVVHALDITIEPLDNSRAAERLACAIGFVRYLKLLCDRTD
jgi:DTW domain-containing protein